MCKCPRCKSISKKRIPRSFPLKLIPFSKQYKCYSCKANFICIPNFFKIMFFKKIIPSNVLLVK